MPPTSKSEEYLTAPFAVVHYLPWFYDPNVAPHSLMKGIFLVLLTSLWCLGSYGQGIVGVQFDWSTHRQEAPGSDNWPTTWSDDGNMYTAWGDGSGFDAQENDDRASLGYARIEGEHDNYVGYNRWGGLDPECEKQHGGKSYGIVSIEGVLYSWVGPGSSETNFNEERLYKSMDYACTWVDTGVVWDKASYGINAGNILNFGQDYAGARDQYVYTYFVDIKDDSGLNIQVPGEILLARVPIADIELQDAYQWYSSSDSAEPAWGEFSEREPVFRDNSGVSWNSASVIHVPGLDRYVLATEHTESGQGNIQMHESPEPWGPWTEFFRESNWPVNAEVQQRSFYWNFASKWFREGGEEFTLVFTGFGQTDSWNTVEGRFELAPLSTADEVILPEEHVLSQNYPNPFESQTTIPYTLASHTNVELELCDLLGKCIPIVSVPRQSTGTYRITLRAEDLSSGVYFYRLRTNGGVQMRRLAVIRAGM